MITLVKTKVLMDKIMACKGNEELIFNLIQRTYNVAFDKGYKKAMDNIFLPRPE